VSSQPQKPNLQVIDQKDIALPAEVRVAYLQAPVNIPWLNISTNTSLTDKTAVGVKMVLTSEGLVLSKGAIRAIIPSTNIKIAVFK